MMELWPIVKEDREERRNRERNERTIQRSNHLPRINWKLHHRRNEYIVKERYHFKKLFGNISSKIRAGETEAALENRSQQHLRNDEHP